MIKLTVNKAKCVVDAKGGAKTIIMESVMANMVLTDQIANATNTSFEAAAMMLMQQSVLAHKQVIDDIKRMQGGDTE